MFTDEDRKNNSGADLDTQAERVGGLKGIKELAWVGFIFIVATALLIMSFELPRMPGQLGPGFWPQLCLSLLLLSCVLKAVEIGRKKAENQDGAVPQQWEESGEVIWKTLCLLILCVFAAVYLMENIGFPLAVFVFILSFLFVTGMKFGLSMCAVSVLGTVVLVYLFVKVVYLPLPKGKWIFESITLFVYRALMIM